MTIQTQSILNWIDTLVDLWALSFRGQTINTYKIIGGRSFPNVPDPPCALTYPLSVLPVYKDGGPNINYWTGRTDLYLFPNTDLANIPDIVAFMPAVIVAAAGAIGLGGLVDDFIIGNDSGPNGIQGPVKLQYNENVPEMHGIVINWSVKENVTDQFSVTI